MRNLLLFLFVDTPRFLHFVKGLTITSEIGSINVQLTEGPIEEEVRRKAKLIQRMIGQIYHTPSPTRL
ncbi:MAG: hypothetical protein ACE144_04400 [Thermodesulfobacteriota bacterium]